MNLFVLVAVPLATLALIQWKKPQVADFRRVRPWGEGSAVAVGSVVLVAFFGKSREFNGDLFASFLGLFWTDAILVPGLVVAAWIARRTLSPWMLLMGLAIAMSAEGLRDTLWGSNIDDGYQLFLSPILRLLIVGLVPLTLPRTLEAVSLWDRVTWGGATGALLVSRPVISLLWYAGWGPIVAVLETAALGGAVWWMMRGAWESEDANGALKQVPPASRSQ